MTKHLKPSKGRILTLLYPLSIFGTDYPVESKWIVEKGGKSILLSPFDELNKSISSLALEIGVQDLAPYFELTNYIYKSESTTLSSKQVHCFSGVHLNNKSKEVV